MVSVGSRGKSTLFLSFFLFLVLSPFVHIIVVLEVFFLSNSRCINGL